MDKVLPYLVMKLNLAPPYLTLVQVLLATHFCVMSQNSSPTGEVVLFNCLFYFS